MTAAHLGGSASDPSTTPFTLIQGPPGTGKTHTVTGVLNTWHHVAYQRYFQPLVAALRAEALASGDMDPGDAAMLGFQEAFERRCSRSSCALCCLHCERPSSAAAGLSILRVGCETFKPVGFIIKAGVQRCILQRPFLDQACIWCMH